MEAFWPGPLTLVLARSPRVPEVVTAGKDSVAVRMPGHPVALELIRRVGEPVAAPSANLFSRPSPTTAAHVLEDLDGRIDAVLDAGPAEVGVESTVLDVRRETPVLLRPGGIDTARLLNALGVPGARVFGLSVPRAGGSGDPGQAGASPGLLVKHYSPRAEVRLYDGEEGAVLEAMCREAAALPGAVVLSYSEDLAEFAAGGAAVVDLGSRCRLEEVARGLYGVFRRLDAEGAAVLLVRTAPSGGLGDALNDRLLRAASGKVIRKGDPTAEDPR
jgi:L-threonylcarbamoyladenylate synthase